MNAYMKSMAKLANLDMTNKNSQITVLEKTTVYNLQKARVSNNKITAVTGHHNVMSLKA